MFNWLKSILNRSKYKTGGAVRCHCDINGWEIVQDGCTEQIYKCVDCGEEFTANHDHHDYEVVQEGNHIRIPSQLSFNSFEYGEIEKNIVPDYNHIRSSDKVCLNCGKCCYGIKEMKELYEAQEEKKRLYEQREIERKELAKRIFKENCCENN